MADGYRLDWKGDDVLSKTQQAQVGGVNEVAAECAVDAAKNTPVRTGLAQGSVRANPAQVQGKRVSALWGSHDVNYYIWLELRGNMLRNAADQFYPKLGEAIKKRMR